MRRDAGCRRCHLYASRRPGSTTIRFRDRLMFPIRDASDFTIVPQRSRAADKRGEPSMLNLARRPRYCLLEKELSSY